MPYGYCHCGCGKKTKLYSFSWKRKGIVKGEPFRYIHGHNSRTEESRDRLSRNAPKAPFRKFFMTHRKGNGLKAGGTMMAKAFADKIFGKKA